MYQNELLLTEPTSYHPIMKQFILVLLITITFQSAQAQRSKELQVRAGVGFGLYGTKSEYGPDNNKIEETGGAVTLYLPVDFRYEITRRFNMGLDLKVGSYLYDPDSADGKSNGYVVVGLGAEYNLKNEEDFRWYFGGGINFANLNLEETNQPFSSFKEEWKYSGVGIRFNTGVLIYIVGDFGLNFNLGFDSHALKLKKYEQNGKEIDLDSFDAKLNLNGVDGTVGLVYRFNLK